MLRALPATLLLTVAAACAESVPEPDREAATIEDIEAIRAAVDEYASDHGALPESLDALIRPDEQGRHYLRTGTPGIHDPWGRRYVFEPRPDGTYEVRRGAGE